jgi:hypothetical protein
MSNLTNLNTLVMTVLLLAISSATVLADIIYVKEGGTGNGTSWDDPNGVLQWAIENANYNDQVWVAEGTYYPDSNGLTDPREASFAMKNGVAIYGGFNGTETALAQRDVQNNKTIFSGDLLRNDNPATPVENLLNDPNRADNCYHVIYNPDSLALDPNTMLNGLTITAGNADAASGGGMYNGGMMYNFSSKLTVIGCTFSGNSAKFSGGGMSNDSSNPTVTDCTFTGNSANRGGGMYCYDSRTTITNCTFNDNLAVAGGMGGKGGGIFADLSSPKVTNCTFTANSAEFGAGIYNSSISTKVVGCTFTGNSTTLKGGGIYTIIDTTVINCAFNGNSAGNGGGMYCYNNNSTISNCTFANNSAVEGGGGMYNWNTNPTVTNCTFIGNSANDGGGMYNNDNNMTGRSPTVSNCIFTGNSATLSGGGMYNRDYRAGATVTGCTFTDNSATLLWGGGMYNISSGNYPTMSNCILWDNTASSGGNEIYNFSSIPVINYCDIAGSGGSGAGWNFALGSDGGGNIDADPMLVDADGIDNSPGTEDDNLRLRSGSPCIDAGDSNSVPADTPDLDEDDNTTEPIPWDLDGHNRFFDDPNTIDTGAGTPPIVDMGAYEFGPFCGDPDHPYPMGDVNNDCAVDIADVAICALAWLTEDGGIGWNPDCNLYEADSIIDASDFAVMGQHWLECTKPECD